MSEEKSVKEILDESIKTLTERKTREREVKIKRVKPPKVDVGEKAFKRFLDDLEKRDGKERKT